MTTLDMTTGQVPDHTHSAFERGKGVAAQATGLSKTYGEGAAKVTALDDVTVEFASGQLTAIMGPSGSGKSTLMHCMAALELRAIGLQRRQLGAMITIEAIATAVFGAVLGTLLGLGLGIALRRGLQSQGLNTLGIPWALIVLMLVASVLVGILAAGAPSIRATRPNILGAINRA